jgi:hypothetical protein
MRPQSLLRSASILTLLFGIGHTLGYPWTGSASPGLLAKVDEIRSMTTVTQGFARSYWDFHVGFGLIISLTFLAQATLLWQLSSYAQTEPRSARAAAALFCGLYLAYLALDFRYFFWAPIVFCAAIAACLAAATLAITRVIKKAHFDAAATLPR